MKAHNRLNLNKDLVIKLYEEGLSLENIADRMGCSLTPVRRTLVENGIKIRPNSFQMGDKHWNYKKGKFIKDGYYKISINGIKISEHRLVWLKESDWGFIPKGFEIHHRNLNKLDNRIANLMCIPKEIHSSAHWEFKREKVSD